MGTSLLERIRRERQVAPLGSEPATPDTLTPDAPAAPAEPDVPTTGGTGAPRGSLLDRVRREGRAASAIGPDGVAVERATDADTAAVLRVMQQQRVNPDRAARIVRLQQQTGLPTTLLDRDLDTIEAQVAGRLFDAERYVNESPILARWLAEDPANLSLLEADLDRIKRLEAAARQAARVERPRRGWLYNLFGAGLAGAGGSMTVGAVGATAEAAGETLVQGATAAAGDTDGNLRQPDPWRRTLDLLAVTTGISLMGRGEQVRDVADGLRERFPADVPSVSEVHDLTDLRDYLSFQLGQAIGSTGAIVAGTAAAGPIGGAAAGWALAFGDVREELEELGVEGIGARNAIAAGLGVPIAALDRLTPGRVAGQLVRRGAPVPLVREAARHGLTRNVAAWAVRELVTEAGTEVAQEFLQHIGTRVAAGAPLEMDALAVRLIDAAIGGAVGGATFGAAGGFLEARRAEQATRFFEALGEEAGKSEVRQRLPEKLQEVVAQLTAEGPVSTIYVDPEVITELFQEAGSDPALEMEQVLGADGAEQLAQAMATGAPLAIPTARYAATLAGSEFHGKLLPFLRLGRPDAMNQAEKDAWVQQAVQRAQQETAAEATDPQRATFAAGVAALEARIAPDLLAANPRLGEDGARQQAHLVARIVGTLADRLGMAPTDLWDRWRVSIGRGDRPAPVQREGRIDRTELVRRALAAREAREAEAIEREALAAESGPLAPYQIPEGERDLRAKDGEGQWVYARTPGGTLRGNLATVSTPGLVAELARLHEANSDDQGRLAPQPLRNNYDDIVVVGNEGTFRAGGRVQARQKSIEKLEVELARRGLDDAEVARLMWELVSGTEAEADASFDFGANDPVDTGAEDEDPWFQRAVAEELSAIDRFREQLDAIAADVRQRAERRAAGEDVPLTEPVDVGVNDTIQQILATVEAERRRLAAERDPAQAEEAEADVPRIVAEAQQRLLLEQRTPEEVAEQLALEFGSVEAAGAIIAEMAGRAGPLLQVSMPGVPTTAERIARVRAGREAAFGWVPATGHRLGDDVTGETLFQLLRAYRHPSAEYFHVLVIGPDNVVAHHRLTSSGVIDQQLVNLGDIAEAAGIAARIGGQVVIAHNHPSGVPTPSRPDMMITDEAVTIVQAVGAQFGGHLVMNHDTATLIEGTSAQVHISLPTPRGGAEWTQAGGIRVSSPTDLFRHLAALPHDERRIDLLLLDTQNKVVALEARPTAAVDTIAEWLPGLLRETGARSAIIGATGDGYARTLRAVGGTTGDGIQGLSVLDIIDAPAAKSAAIRRELPTTNASSPTHVPIFEGEPDGRAGADLSAPGADPAPAGRAGDGAGVRGGRAPGRDGGGVRGADATEGDAGAGSDVGAAGGDAIAARLASTLDRIATELRTLGAQRDPATVDGALQELLAAADAELRRLATERRSFDQEQPATPPPAPGTVRVYHAGAPNTDGGARWVSRQQDYAEGWQRMRGGQLWYVDLPADHPLLHDEFWDDQPGPTNFELPAEWASQFRPFVPESRDLSQRDDTDPLGRIRFTSEGVNIELLAGANFSTFLHESAHLYLEMLRTAVAGENVPEGLRQDWETLRTWLGADEGQPLTREQHEQFARGFEAYLMEGQAPVAELRTIFARVRAWLVLLYRTVQGLGPDYAPLSTEVRRVMDRMVATDEEIAAAEAAIGAEPVLDLETATAVLGEARARDYLATVERARHTAAERLQQQLMAAHQREATAVWQAERARVREEVAAEVDEEPLSLAWAMLARGTLPSGAPLPDGVEPIKLSREAMRRDFPALLERLPSRRMAQREGGKVTTAHPDVLADFYGYTSGEAFLEALVTHPDPRERIEALTDDRMAERHTDLLTSAELADEALSAVHNEDRARLLAEELRILTSQELATFKGLVRGVANPIRRTPSVEEAREAARQVIARTAVKDIQPHRWRQAEGKAGREAVQALLRGDIEAALQAKQRQLLNHELVRAAEAARERVAKLETLAMTMFRRDGKIGPTRDIGLVSAARAIATAWGLGREGDTEPLRHLEPLRRYEPDTYDTLAAQVDAATATAPDYNGQIREAPYEIAVALHDTLDGLWSLARRSQQMVIDGRLEDRAAIEAALTARVKEIQTTDYAARGRVGTLSEKDKAVNVLLGFRAALTRVEHWVHLMDSGAPDGVFRRYLWQPIADAAARYRREQRDVVARYLEIVKTVEPGLRQSKPIAAPELNFTFRTKAELLAALLHTGNDSNLDKLLRGHNWTPEGWEAFLRRAQSSGILTKADYDYVQAVWDLLEDLKPAAQQAHRAMYGYYFDEITAQEFVTPWGRYRGGYFPARTDPNRTSDAARRQAADALLGEDNSFMFPSTGKGFTKSRVQQYARPLSLDLGGVPLHIDAVLRFAHLQAPVRDLGVLLTRTGFRDVLESFDPAIVDEMLVPWLQRTARQSVSAPATTKVGRALDGFWRKARARSGLFLMALNVKNTLEQVTGFAAAASQVSPKYLGRALWRYLQAPRETGRAIAEQSAFMDTRVATQIFDIQQRINDIVLDPSPYETVQAFAERNGYILQQSMQNMVDTIVWSGAYEQAVAEGATDAQAVRRADAAVRLTQGSFAPEDISRAEAGTAFTRMWLMFFSYFNTMANLQRSEYTITVRELGLRKGAGRLVVLYTLLHIIPSVIADGLSVAMRGGSWDEDEDGWVVDDLLALFFGSQLRSGLAMVPGVGQVVTAAIDRWDDRAWNDRISLSPVVSLAESAVGAASGRSVTRALEGTGSTKTAVRDVFTLLSLLTGVPLLPAAKGIGYYTDVQEGRIAPPTGPVDAVRGVLSGTGPR